MYQHKIPASLKETNFKHSNTFARPQPHKFRVKVPIKLKIYIANMHHLARKLMSRAVHELPLINTSGADTGGGVQGSGPSPLWECRVVEPPPTFLEISGSLE